jgi:short-subunit dehydrogenase
MLGHGGGRIVNVSSMGGVLVLPGVVTYSASKAALTHFTAGLRADLADCRYPLTGRAVIRRPVVDE